MGREDQDHDMSGGHRWRLKKLFDPPELQSSLRLFVSTQTEQDGEKVEEMNGQA